MVERVREEPLRLRESDDAADHAGRGVRRETYHVLPDEIVARLAVIVRLEAVEELEFLIDELRHPEEYGVRWFFGAHGTARYDDVLRAELADLVVTHQLLAAAVFCITELAQPRH